MSNPADVSLSAAKDAVVVVLREHAKQALFVTELTAALRRKKVGKDEMEQALSELQTGGVIVVRDNFCADPHLENVDLRVVALVEGERSDSQLAALHEIDRAWNKWLGEYLANHRCG